MSDNGAVLKVRTRYEGDAAIVELSGKIDEPSAKQMAEALNEELQRPCDHIIVDLSDISYLTSTALGAFMIAFKTLRERNGWFRVVGSQPLIREILDTTKLTRLFQVFDTVEEALKG